MCKQCDDAARSTSELSGDALGKVTGGAKDDSVDCYFTPAGQEKKVDDGGYTYKLKLCNSNCFGYFDRCFCHGTDQCKDRWHRIDNNGYLYPSERSNHFHKKPGNNYNT